MRRVGQQREPARLASSASQALVMAFSRATRDQRLAAACLRRLYFPVRLEVQPSSKGKSEPGCRPNFRETWVSRAEKSY